jgi:hypothetical protein
MRLGVSRLDVQNRPPQPIWVLKYRWLFDGQPITPQAHSHGAVMSYSDIGVDSGIPKTDSIDNVTTPRKYVSPGTVSTIGAISCRSNQQYPVVAISGVVIKRALSVPPVQPI